MESSEPGRFGLISPPLSAHHGRSSSLAVPQYHLVIDHAATDGEPRLLRQRHCRAGVRSTGILGSH
jgi:hypothetical protein